MSKITINGVELELDLLDADVMEKYEKALTEISDKIQEPTQYDGISNADAIRVQCRHVDSFFDKLFGAGTAAQVFEGGCNLGVRLDAFGKIANMSESVDHEVIMIREKYNPSRIKKQSKKKKTKYRNNKYRGR